MSDYPPVPPYGASYGGQPQTNTPYHAYQNPYMQQDGGSSAQAHIASNYDASMTAYGYNNAIPGFGVAPLPSAPPQLGSYQGWNQDVHPLPSYPTPQNNMSYPAFNPFQPPSSYSAPPPQTYQQNNHQNPPFDEGEISEGDGYADQAAVPAAATNYGSAYYQGNDGTGYMNTAQRAVYPSGQDFNNQQYATGNDYNTHRESASYSPHAAGATLEPNQDDRSKRKRSYNKYASIPATEQSAGNTTQSYTPIVPLPQVRTGKSVDRKHNPSKSLPAKPSILEKPLASKAIIASRSPGIQTPVQDNQSPFGGFQSVAEARKKAEGAVLNLWPYDIRFPIYVQEGFDENLTGGLFDRLGLSRAAKIIPVVSEEAPTADRVNGTNLKAGIPGLGRENVASKSNMALGSSSLERPSNDVDFPKEREALVEQNGNGVAIPAALSAQNKPAEPTEKEKNLKLKMEMLRKSREERAQKAAAKITTSSVATAPPEASKPINSPTSKSNSSFPSALPQPPSQTPPKPPAHPIAPPQPIVKSTPVIPGLSLHRVASNSSPVPSPSIQVTNGSSQVPQRKRPVAADFDTSTSTKPYKRPFGQSRHDSVVFDVSEDEADSEDEDVAMELDSQAESPVQSARKLSEQRAAAIQGLPPLTNFPTRKIFATPPGPSAASTPPVPKASGNPQVLQQKETEIEALKKMIAAREAASAKKKAQKSASGAATPQNRALQPVSDPINTNGDMASKVEASLQMQRLIGIAEENITSDQKKLAETQAAELEKAADVKRNEAESRRVRRELIATDLPRVDAEVEQSQLKLQQLREEIAKAEAAVHKSMEAKRRLADEMERLGQETEEQLQEQKTRLKNLTEPEVSSNADSPRAAFISGPQADDEQATLSMRPHSFHPGPPESGSPTAASGPAKDPLVVDSHVPTQSSCPSSRTSSVESPIEAANGVDHSTADHAMEAALQETIRADADSHEEGEVGMDIDMDDSYAPDPALLAPESPRRGVTPTVSENQTHNYGLSNGVEAPNTLFASPMENEDEYEPPEATPAADPPMDSPPFSPAPPESVADVEEFVYDMPALEQTVDSKFEDGGLEKPGNGSVPESDEEKMETSNQIQSFTPYESPLKAFRAYRFHPEFKQQVFGGYKSLSYSHKINPEIEFCLVELIRGVCEDESCEYQHFRDIALAEDAILSTLGSPDDIPTDQRQKFREGLRAVLGSLRQRKVRDFDTITGEIVAYRSQCLGDSSKVLMLEGTRL